MPQLRRAQPYLIQSLLLCVLAAGALPAQAARSDPPTSSQIRAAAREVMADARYATMVTLDSSGHPQSRVVDPLLGAGDTIWIATNPLTRKVREIERDSRITLMFFDQAAGAYVTVLGHATIATDARRNAEHWKSEWAPFYREGYAGRDFTLIAVRPFRLEVSSPRHGLSNDARTWRPVVLEIR